MFVRSRNATVLSRNSTNTSRKRTGTTLGLANCRTFVAVAVISYMLSDMVWDNNDADADLRRGGRAHEPSLLCTDARVRRNVCGRHVAADAQRAAAASDRAHR